MTPEILIPAGVALVILIWFIATFNRFVGLRNHIKESWSDIDVELKRRYELIPNLVETVKGYAKHERETLDRLTELRARASANNGTPASQSIDETAMLMGMRKVFLVAEGYPDLKADENFLALQRQLSLTEDRIAASRRFYNGNVRDMRQLCQQFPSSLIAGMFSFEVPTFFELDSEAERAVPRVDLGTGA